MDADDNEFLKIFYRQVADTALDPASDRRYEPLYGDGAEAIGEDPIEFLARTIEWLEGESVQLLSGFRGTGKSTELRRLRDRLQAKGYHVVLLDMEDHVNMTAEIDVSDFLMALAGAFSEALTAPSLLGADPKQQGYWTRLSALLTRTRIELPDVSVQGVKASLKRDPTFRKRLQDQMSGHLGALVEDAHDFFQETIQSLRGKHGRSAELVLLVDSMEHIRGTSVNAETVQASVENLFAGHYDKLRLPGVHVVYTVPPYITVRYPNLGMLYGAGAVQTFPAIRIRSVSREVHAGAVAALRRVVERRGDVARLLDGGHLLDEIILASGGHLRDLFHVLAEVIRRARSLPVDKPTVDAAIQRIRSGFLPIADNDARWLARIAQTNEASLADVGHSKDLSRFLDTHVVLCYRNGAEWYDVHPLIRDVVLEQSRELEEREAQTREPQG
jgi:AAA ATPase domain